MTRQSFNSRFPAENYLNREIGLLAFNRRVLAQALDETVPLLERLRFLTIVSSNLDEFFEVRVAGLKEQIKANAPIITTDGRTAHEVFQMVTAEAHALVTEQYRTLNDIILPALSEQGTILMELGPTFWSQAFAVVTDRFGVTWMINMLPYSC